MLIREVMTTPAVTVMTQSSTATALWLMRTEQVGSIPVVDDRGALIGIIDETDLVQDEALVADRVLASAGRVAGTTPSRRVGDAMTHHVVTVSPDDQIDVAVDLMQSMMLEQLPVVENDHVVGTVGRGDMTRLLPSPSRFCQFEASCGTARGVDAVRNHH
ncbi:CBS domain-containing protein [Kribbella sp. NBC_01484]|uniref:CBS domain-containing protein n=1 Tax=Kribbella sp. NBC_01484 TaxID=2903579 RepID=UPI002E339801|nr:CBS domain-containing protein [Kribbella sp. NBC_01484]